MIENTTPRLKIIPSSIFIALFVFVFLLVSGFNVITAFLHPKVYKSTARIQVESKTVEINNSFLVQTQTEVIQSELIMKKVVSALDLNRAWAKDFNAADGYLKTSDCLKYLEMITAIRSIQNS